MSCGAESIVGFHLHHWPHLEPRRAEDILEQLELAGNAGLDSGAILVPRPHLVPERLDHMVGRDADVGGTFLEQLDHRSEHSTGRPDLSTVCCHMRRCSEVIAKEFVGSIDQVCAHGTIIVHRGAKRPRARPLIRRTIWYKWNVLSKVLRPFERNTPCI